MELIAHLRPADGVEEGRYELQTLREHCAGAAEYASAALSSIGLSNTARLCGMIHDMGKATELFNKYIRSDGAMSRGSVNHTFAAVRYMIEKFHGNSKIFSELIAYAAGAHHGQFDAVNEDHGSGFDYRLTKEDIFYGEAAENFTRECFSGDEIEALFEKAQSELETVVEKISASSAAEFELGLLARLLLSAVIEGDRRDTAEFMENMRFSDVRADWNKCLQHIEAKLNEFPCDKPIDRARRDISDTCRAAAQGKPGIYRLNVPTGGGKTLSGLRFAVAHAMKNNSNRLIFTSPLLSILDQNAEVIRSFVGDDRIITEHHSNVVHDESESDDELRRSQLLTENWSSPIIITTMVQLLDTLFSGRTSCIRRMQALCNSVIVIDEVQTVPSDMLSLFNTAVNFLARICRATVILCSATQPCLESAEHPIELPITDIAPLSEETLQVFRRTKIINGGRMKLTDIPEFVKEKGDSFGSALVICNLKKQAAFLFQALSDSGAAVYHLSAGMCMAHRKATLKAINTALQKRREHPESAPEVICVSTQVIEAGVDVSFGCVIRLCAGLDSIVQAAGRCNRNGEFNGKAPVYVIKCVPEDISRLREIKDGQIAALSLLSDYGNHPEKYPLGLTSDAAVSSYYSRLYSNAKQHEQDFVTKVGNSACTLFDLLSQNNFFANNDIYIRKFGGRFILKQAFKTAGDHFSVFGENTVDVIVPYKEGKELILKLGSKRAEHDIEYAKKLLDSAKSYTVSIYENQQRALCEKGALFTVAHSAVFVLDEAFYDSENLGFIPDGREQELLLY